MAESGPSWTFHLTGGQLCLDFANTISWRFSGRATDRLPDYGELLSWTRQARVLPREECRRLAVLASQRPHDAATVLERARDLREALYRSFRAIIDHGRPLPDDIAAINRALAHSMAQWHLEGARAPFKLVWGSRDTLDPMLGPVLKSAAELLASDELNDLRTCGNPKCGWLFVDRSRNRMRRWCDMKVCGNRGKAQRYHERHQRAGT